MKKLFLVMSFVLAGCSADNLQKPVDGGQPDAVISCGSAEEGYRMICHYVPKKGFMSLCVGNHAAEAHISGHSKDTYGSCGG